MACQKKAPKGWVETPRRGFIVDDVFLPFKTALDERYEGDVSSKYRFDTKMFREIILENYVALVIALIDIEPFYNPKDIEEINHIRVKLSKRKGPPSMKKILGFNKLVKLCLSFDSRCKIAVQCLHGYNMTGYMIVNFLVMERKMSLKDALEIFAEARPPGIYDKEYLKKLSALHDSKMKITFPDPPQWEVGGISQSGQKFEQKRPYEDRRSGHAQSRSGRLDRSREFSGVRREQSKYFRPERTIESSASRSEYPKYSSPIGKKRKNECAAKLNEPSSKKKKEEGEPGSMTPCIEIPQRTDKNFVEQHKKPEIESFVIRSKTRELTLDFLVPISERYTDIKQNIHEDIQKIMSKNVRHSFFGQRYISITKATIDRFRRFKYYMTWRTDGRRLMMFIIDERTVFMIDEMSNYYRVKKFKFPHWMRKNEYLRYTILEGELVVDNVKDRDFFNFLICDIYSLDGEKINYSDYMERLQTIQKRIIIPRKLLTPCELADEHFRIQLKTVSEMCFLRQTWEKLRLEIPHEMTGLIFHPAIYSDVSRKYIWIPSTHKFVRFFLKASFDKSASKWVGILSTREKDTYYEIKYITEEEKNKYDRRIVKCTYNANNKTWSIIGVDNEVTFLPYRSEVNDDKRDMENPVTFEDLAKLFNV